MIIEEFRQYQNNPPVLANFCSQECVNPCDNIYEPLRLELSANHGCNDAEFDCYIKLFAESQALLKNVWLYVTRLNFNTSEKGNPALATINLTKSIVERANLGKAESRDRGVCCNLDIKAFGCHFPNSVPYNVSDQTISLPFSTDTDIYLPPLEQETYILENRNRARIHDNIISTTIIRESDGVVLVDGKIWYGGLELDLCKELTNPGDTGPVRPVL
jgi:hypothetical protein